MLAQPVEADHEVARAAQDVLAVLVRLHPLGAAGEEGAAQLVLDPFQLGAGGGLGELQACGRSADAAGLGDGEQDTEVAELEVHGHPPLRTEGPSHPP
ncbi:hypothetical protein O1L60_00760 [Streptomyces diastatochromogenes]|nr:hypothetical protein [Streptomyces diastatochromogenes]